jgi:superoxide dismutase, Fe-Mn family
MADEQNERYTLPELPYAYNALSPQMSEEQLRLHHDKHHLAYVNGANAALDRLEKARAENSDLDQKALLKELSFNVSGHILHSLFWTNLSPEKESGEPRPDLKNAIEKEFGSVERFKKEFTAAALSTEGSGWAALALCKKTRRLMLMQIEKHNVNVIPTLQLLLVLDVWEHAYYVDYRNLRVKFIEAFWNIVNWDEVGRRLEEARE